MERALEAEMATHLGYEKSDPIEKPDGNRRNGKSKKTLKGDFGEMEIVTPRDREATFEPRLIGKGETRMAGLDGKIISTYARGMTTRDIQGHLVRGQFRFTPNPDASRMLYQDFFKASGVDIEVIL
jgi:putative transposase